MLQLASQASSRQRDDRWTGRQVFHSCHIELPLSLFIWAEKKSDRLISVCEKKPEERTQHMPHSHPLTSHILTYSFIVRVFFSFLSHSLSFFPFSLFPFSSAGKWSKASLHLTRAIGRKTEKRKRVKQAKHFLRLRITKRKTHGHSHPYEDSVTLWRIKQAIVTSEWNIAWQRLNLQH